MESSISTFAQDLDQERLSFICWQRCPLDAPEFAGPVIFWVPSHIFSLPHLIAVRTILLPLQLTQLKEAIFGHRAPPPTS